MTNPYISKQDLTEKRKSVRKEAVERFSKQVEKTLSEALEDLSLTLENFRSVLIDLNPENLSRSLCESILQEHCDLLVDLGYDATIDDVDVNTGIARIALYV